MLRAAYLNNYIYAQDAQNDRFRRIGQQIVDTTIAFFGGRELFEASNLYSVPCFEIVFPISFVSLYQI